MAKNGKHRWDGALTRHDYSVIWAPALRMFVRLIPYGDGYTLSQI